MCCKYIINENPFDYKCQTSYQGLMNDKPPKLLLQTFDTHISMYIIHTYFVCLNQNSAVAYV